jgi:hypothetical protein
LTSTFGGIFPDGIPSVVRGVIGFAVLFIAAMALHRFLTRSRGRVVVRKLQNTERNT